MKYSEIPIPPSANRIWRIFGNRMHKSKQYTEWLEHVAWLLRRDLSNAPVPCCVVIEIHGGKGWHKARDLDNTIKPAIDALRASGVLVEDTCDYVSRVEAIFRAPESKKAEATCLIGVGLP